MSCPFTSSSDHSNGAVPRFRISTVLVTVRPEYTVSVSSTGVSPSCGTPREKSNPLRPGGVLSCAGAEVT